MTIDQYIETINNRYRPGNIIEHRFHRDVFHLPELDKLLRGIDEFEIG
jgi:hypothetical protein